MMSEKMMAKAAQAFATPKLLGRAYDNIERWIREKQQADGKKYVMNGQLDASGNIRVDLYEKSESGTVYVKSFGKDEIVAGAINLISGK